MSGAPHDVLAARYVVLRDTDCAVSAGTVAPATRPATSNVRRTLVRPIGLLLSVIALSTLCVFTEHLTCCYSPPYFDPAAPYLIPAAAPISSQKFRCKVWG